MLLYMDIWEEGGALYVCVLISRQSWGVTLCMMCVSFVDSLYVVCVFCQTCRRRGTHVCFYIGIQEEGGALYVCVFIQTYRRRVALYLRENLLGGGFSTLYPIFYLICTINSELKSFSDLHHYHVSRGSICACVQWTGSTPAGFQEAFCVNVCVLIQTCKKIQVCDSCVCECLNASMRSVTLSTGDETEGEARASIHI